MSDLLDIKQAAPILGISEHGLRQLCKAKKIKHMRTGANNWLYRFRREWLDEYIETTIVEVEDAKPKQKPTLEIPKKPGLSSVGKRKSFREMVRGMG